jgi:alpha-beta hydrolase superfamily lysophospholipase
MKLKRPPTYSLVLVGLVLSVLIGRAYAYHRLQRTMLKVRPQSQKTPLQYGAPYEELSFPSEWRTLKAFYVAPPAGEHKAAVLIFHGNDESIASWSPVQGYLYQHGLGSMVFDYSGFGHSDGTPTVDHARADGLAAWSVFKDHLPPGTRACGYGLSLGTGVLLDDVARFQSAPDCLVVYGAYTSAIGAAVRVHAIPSWLGPLLPDVLESVKNASHLPAPLLVVHGDHDQIFPVEDARQIADAAHARLVVLPGFTHAQPLVAPDDAGWCEIVSFVRGDK